MYVQTLVMEDEATGVQDVHICVGGPDIDRLADGVRAAFESVLLRHLPRVQFGGEIHVVVLGEVTPQTPALWQTISELERELRGVIASRRLRTASGVPVLMSFEFTDAQER